MSPFTNGEGDEGATDKRPGRTGVDPGQDDHTAVRNDGSIDACPCHPTAKTVTAPVIAAGHRLAARFGVPPMVHPVFDSAQDAGERRS
jgi:hypothetical protein